MHQVNIEVPVLCSFQVSYHGSAYLENTVVLRVSDFCYSSQTGAVLISACLSIVLESFISDTQH